MPARARGDGKALPFLCWVVIDRDGPENGLLKRLRTDALPITAQLGIKRDDVNPVG